VAKEAQLVLADDVGEPLRHRRREPSDGLVQRRGVEQHELERGLLRGEPIREPVEHAAVEPLGAERDAPDLVREALRGLHRRIAHAGVGVERQHEQERA
jgi:hypothetical protein